MRIAIDCGHTLNSADYGAVGIKAESNLTREVGRKVMALLRSQGHTVIDCTCDGASSLNASLSHRYNTANNNNADYFISIHFNAYNGTAKGTEILYYSSADERMNRILKNIVALGYTNRGLKQRTNLAVLKNTNAKAMLIECCFCDNKGDMNKFNSDKMAKAIVEGFTGKTVTSNPTPSPSQPKISTHLRDFQRAYNRTYGANILVDGIMGAQTEQAIARTIIKYGQRNDLVAWIQCRVGTNADGIFGAMTQQRVIEFQRKNGLVADGIAGAKTIKKILSIYNW